MDRPSSSIWTSWPSTPGAEPVAADRDDRHRRGRHRAHAARRYPAGAGHGVGQYLPQLCVGPGDLQLRLSDGVTITFESPVRFPDGTVVEPYGLDGLARFLPLLNADVTGVRVDGDAGLTVTLGDTEVHCPADPEFEAWNVSGDDGLLVVCTPGGGLAIWPPG